MAAVILRGKDWYWRAEHACWAAAIYFLSLGLPALGPNSEILPAGGLLASVCALGMLVHCIKSPTSALAGDWLLGLAWLANPAAWAGVIFLMAGRMRRTALAGELALMLAAGALRPHFSCQYIWLASMVYVMYAALCVPGDVSAANNRMFARLRLPKVRPIFYAAVALPVLFGLLLLLLGRWGLIKSTLLP